MCGIAGILSKTSKLSPDRLAALAAAMTDTMAHRGPDDQGVWLSRDKRAALAHCRLSIIDTSNASHQPMTGSDGLSAIAYNGELYNFHDVKQDLETAGDSFSTSGDTEVVLKALERWGTDALLRFDGMFAFGHYDGASGRLLLARDIFGEKPLYYVDAPDYFAFASELHALTRLPDFDARVDRDAIAAYLSFQYVPAPLTIYRSVRKLMPGHWLRGHADGSLHVERFFTFETSDRRTAERSIDDLGDELEALLVTSVKRRMISDVPLGGFLSGGVDSSTVAAIATKRLGVPLETFSIGFEGHEDSEHFDAAEIARLLGTRHRDKVLTADTIELGSHIGKVLDEPNADTSCLPTYLLCQFARERVTVALSGDGGDELFGGYGRYFNTADEWARKKAGDEQLAWWSAGEVYLSNRVLIFDDEALSRVCGGMPAGLADTLASMRRAINDDERPLLNVMRELDARTYMPGAVLSKVDRMSMQHSLEVRAPLLGIDIANFAMRLSADECYGDGQGKLVLKNVAERYLPSEWMRRRKRGFGLPMDMWGVSTLMPALRGLILDPECRLAEWISPQHLERYLNHLEREFQAYRAWALFVLEVWLRMHPAVPAQASDTPLEFASPLRRKAKWLSRLFG